VRQEVIFLIKIGQNLYTQHQHENLDIVTPVTLISQPIDGQIKPNLYQLQATGYLLSTFDYLTNVEALI
jgi:hypothetical protein